MLEYLDSEKRKTVLRIIYAAYINNKKSTNATILITPQVVADWENFRFKWIQENIMKPLENEKQGKNKNGK